MRAAQIHEVNFTFIPTDKASTLQDARAWGRIAARLGWGLGELEKEVAPEFQQAAREAYDRRMAQLAR